MQRRPVRFFSERMLLDGDLYLPDDLQPGERRPAVITTSGYQGLKDIHPVRFARALVPLGFVCLAFDYRGFGHSEGERGRLAPQDQVFDVQAAASFLESVPEVDSDRIGLLGWALGGGVAIGAAAEDHRVGAVATVNAIGDGRRALRWLHDEESWSGLLEQVAEDRRQRALRGRSWEIHPFDVVRLDSVTREYVDAELYKAAGFGRGVTFESVDLLLRFRPDAVVHRITPRPLLLLHGADNHLHNPDESRWLYAAAGEPRELEMLEGTGHTEWMYDEHPTFCYVVDRCGRFFADAFDFVMAAGASSRTGR